MNDVTIKLELNKDIASIFELASFIVRLKLVRYTSMHTDMIIRASIPET